MKYPQVLSEVETLERVCYGASLARYGDGELALAEGRSIPCQVVSQDLSARLRGILHESGSCMVGIPNLHSPTPKIGYWRKYAKSASLFLSSRRYVSQFVTRPDSAPWIDTDTYWAQLESLWRGHDVTLVRGSGRSLTASDLDGARSVTEVLGPPINAWSSYAALLEQIGKPARALLCLGPTATVMAVDLCALGVHAIDLGHIGLFLKKHRTGAPMVRTEADKVLQ